MSEFFKALLASNGLINFLSLYMATREALYVNLIASN